MKRIKTEEELEMLTNPQLLAYRKEMKHYAKYLSTCIDDLKNAFHITTVILKERLEDLEYDMLEAEIDRENCDVYTSSTQLEVN